MTEADILALTYDDTCTVYRPGKVVLPSGESQFQKGLEGVVVYENIPCALSSPTGGKPTKTQTVVTADTDYRLFVRPEIDIQPGDTVRVIRLGKTNPKGKQTIALAGVADQQPSHNNIPLKLEKSTA